jgi:hypothetical protein
MTWLEQHRHSNLQLALSDNVQTDQTHLDWKPYPYNLEKHREKFSIFDRSGENGINSPFSGMTCLEQHRHSNLQLALSDNVPRDPAYLDWKPCPYNLEKHHEKFSIFDRFGENGINSPFSGMTWLEQHRHSNIHLALPDNVPRDPTYLDCKPSSHHLEKHCEKFSIFDRSGENGINSPFSWMTCLEQHRHSNLQLALTDIVPKDPTYSDWKPSPYDIEKHREKFSIFDWRKWNKLTFFWNDLTRTTQTLQSPASCDR